MHSIWGVLKRFVLQRHRRLADDLLFMAKYQKRTQDVLKGGSQTMHKSSQTIHKKGRQTATSRKNGSACWARTSDPLINSQLLYQLS